MRCFSPPLASPRRSPSSAVRRPSGYAIRPSQSTQTSEFPFPPRRPRAACRPASGDSASDVAHSTAAASAAAALHAPDCRLKRIKTEKSCGGGDGRKTPNNLSLKTICFFFIVMIYFLSVVCTYLLSYYQIACLPVCYFIGNCTCVSQHRHDGFFIDNLGKYCK